MPHLYAKEEMTFIHNHRGDKKMTCHNKEAKLAKKAAKEAAAHGAQKSEPKKN